MTRHAPRTGPTGRPEVVGAHLCDHGLHLVRLRAVPPHRPVVTARLRLPVIAGSVRHGLPGLATLVTAGGAVAAGRFARGTPVHVALTTPDCAVVPATRRASDPLAALAAAATPHGPPVDAVWAGALTVADHTVAWAGARRSSIVRTTTALRAAGLPVAAVHAGPACAVLAALALAARPPGAWTLQVGLGVTEVRLAVGPTARIDGGTCAADPARPGASAFLVGRAGLPGTDLGPALAERLGGGRLLRPCDVSSFAPAYGAALAALRSGITSPDLARGSVVRPLATGSELPRWAIETLAPSPAAAIATRRQGRLAARRPRR